MSRWLGQLDLMELNFPVTVVLRSVATLLWRLVSELTLGLGATEHCTSTLVTWPQCHIGQNLCARKCVRETSLKVVEAFVSHQFPPKLDTT